MEIALVALVRPTTEFDHLLFCCCFFWQKWSSNQVLPLFLHAFFVSLEVTWNKLSGRLCIVFNWNVSLFKITWIFCLDWWFSRRRRSRRCRWKAKGGEKKLKRWCEKSHVGLESSVTCACLMLSLCVCVCVRATQLPCVQFYRVPVQLQSNSWANGHHRQHHWPQREDTFADARCERWIISPKIFELCACVMCWMEEVVKSLTLSPSLSPCMKKGFGLMRKVHAKSTLPDSIFRLQHKDGPSAHAVAGKKDEVTGSKVQPPL